MPIYFYTPHEDPYGDFSNFSRHGFEAKGQYWPTVEHYFQAQKFAQTPYEQVIRAAKTPKQAKDLGRSRQQPLRPDWEAVKDGIMLEALLLKFTTHPDLGALLLATGDEVLVENPPSDYYWGCGADGSGLNQLGKLLMQVRATLRNQTPLKT